MIGMLLEILWGIIRSPVVLVCIVAAGLLIALVYLTITGAWIGR